MLIAVLLLIIGLAKCFPVTAGGNSSVATFFCEVPGCAAHVTKVFCDEEELLRGSDIKECTGRPTPKSVCQHDGRAFVSISEGSKCDFEGEDSYIETKECTGTSTICTFPSVTSSSQHVYIVLGVIGSGALLGALCGLILYCRRGRQNHAQNQPPESVPLSEMQSPQRTSERDTPDDTPDAPGLLDDGRSHLQRDRT